MGRLQADEFARLTDIRTALSWHLSSNHYPPIPAFFIDTCLVAIANANEGNWNATIDLPVGVEWRGQTSCPTSALIEWAHLESFLTDEDEDESL